MEIAVVLAKRSGEYMYRVVFCGCLLLLAVQAGPSNAAIVLFDLQGNAGNGLLPGNENPAVNGGSGGERGSGISYDDASNILTLDIGWGSGNGFADLTGPVTVAHIHDAGGPSFSSNGPPLFTLHSLAGFNTSATSGGFAGTVQFANEQQEQNLLAGHYYINIHTAANGAGEIRGNLTAVPEPSILGLAGLGLITLGLRRQRKRS
jgi:hypothetical protein